MLGMKVEKKTIQYFGLPIGTHYKKFGDLIFFSKIKPSEFGPFFP
jgi:hypothetical protein